jgi:hypothetical protein
MRGLTTIKSPRGAAQPALARDADGAGAGAGEGEDESGPPPQKKVKDEEAGSSKAAPAAPAAPAPGSMDEWVQSTFGPSGFDWPAERCAALSAALAEEELVTAVSVAKMDDGDVDAIIRNAGLKMGSAQNFKEGHAALQKAI